MAKRAVAARKAPTVEEYRHDLFLEVIGVLHKYDVQEVAEMADVHFTTLYSWLREDGVMCPRLTTLYKVLPVIGLELQVVKAGKPKARPGYIKRVK